MRICHITTATLDTHYFKNLAEGFSARGLDSIWVSLTEKQRPSWMQQLDGINYFSLDAPTRVYYPRAVFRLARLLRKHRIDLLQTHLFDAGLVGVLAARLAQIPVIVTRHHLDQAFLIGTRMHIALDGWMARQADHVVVLSQAVRNHLINAERIDRETVETNYQGFDFEALSPTDEDRQRIRAEFNFTSEFVIGCVAQLFKTKGHLYLLSAIKDLVPEIPEIRVLLLGTGDRSFVETIVNDLGLKERVVFAGFRTDAAACMKAMDLLVHPSLSEAFCQVLIEGMAVGTAVISTDVGGAPEVITDGETGLLVPPADAKAIAEAVLSLYRDPQRRSEIASAGQTSVRRRFTVPRMVVQQIECYQRLLNGSPSRREIHVGS